MAVAYPAGMSVEITRVGVDARPPSTVGAVIVRQPSPGQSEVRFIMRDGPVRIYSSSLGRGDDFERATEWALEWAARRRVDRIYVLEPAVAKPTE